MSRFQNIYLRPESNNCEQYNPDKVFKRFNIIEFPTSYVGLSTTKVLDVKINLNVSAYLKTMCINQLRVFTEASEVSAHHRAFDILQVDNHTLAITFTPKNECISRVKQNKQFDNRFVFDLRLIQVDGTRCCNNEMHSEIGRYYICGEFEYCKITHSPKVVNFGDVPMNNRVTKYVRISNESNIIAAKMKYARVTGFDIRPQYFTIPPNSSRRLSITIKPTCLKIRKEATFQIRNPHDVFKEQSDDDDDNFLTYKITLKANVIYHETPRRVIAQSLHTLHEKLSKYTFMANELTMFIKRKQKAYTYLNIAKSLHVKKPITEGFSTHKTVCILNDFKDNTKSNPDFCKIISDKINTYCLFDILVLPFSIDFGNVSLHTYGERELTIKNNSKYDVIINLLPDNRILYTKDKAINVILKLKSMSVTNVSILCWGSIEGNYRGTFEYAIDNTYYRKHPYQLKVGNPTLVVLEKCLKFGMVTTESFVTSVPVRICNYFNVSVGFHWDELHPETPLEIIPSSGFIPNNGCKICDVIYACKSTKTKTHEIDLITESKQVIPVEISVITRKLSIKFSQPAVTFRDVALNIKTIESVRLENSSKEIALFHVLEPLIPGFTIEPMNGVIKPKMVLTFNLIVNISCILEFAFDIYVKINNKENVILPVYGNVVEPRLLINPKHICMSRIPCNMITYVPVTFQNISSLKTFVEVMDTGDENIFHVYIGHENDKQRIFEFEIDGGQTKTVLIKVFDTFRREYEMFIPFKINSLLGPPDLNSCSMSTELQYYIKENEQLYENNPKVKLKKVNKDISYCRISGVFTVPWILFSVETFEIDYKPNHSNAMEFTMTNISKYYLYVTILTAKLAPHFTLGLQTEKKQSIINEVNLKFELDCQHKALLTLKFHPKGHGKFVSTALLYLDQNMTTPYYNLTFIGKRQTPALSCDTHRVIFPPCLVKEKMSRTITLKLQEYSDKDSFSCISREEENLNLRFCDCNHLKEGEQIYTTVTVEIDVSCQRNYARNLILTFNHACGSCCDVEVCFCFTYCPITLHATNFVKTTENPYPYFPLSTQTDLYNYLENCRKFLEKWMYQQGFRRELYPVIPDSFHAISAALTSQMGAKPKGLNISYLNFVKRISGPLMKHIKKISLNGVDESFKSIKEIHDTYREIIHLITSRGGDFFLQAKFLLSFDQFVIFTEHVTPKCNADIILTRELLADSNLFNRLNKQSWIDFILQTYKVFIMDSCFLKCVCDSSDPRDIIKVLTDWFNEQIAKQDNKLRGKLKSVKVIKNITTDLSDGIAIAASIINYCSFMTEHFSYFCAIDENDPNSGIINNACLIIEAMNLLRLNFPLNSQDFIEPNFVQMLFLSIHLYVALPMFKPKEIVKFNPPLLRSSTRQVVITPANQESLTFTFMLLNNPRNNFSVDKAQTGDNGKKIVLNVKFSANFTYEEQCILLVYGYNKTRIFDTYMVFLLHGHIGSLIPVRKCKVTGPLYRPNKIDVLVTSPFLVASTYKVYVTDNEPVIPVNFDEDQKPKFYLRRLNLIDREINLSALPKESGQEVQEHKLFLLLNCLSTQIGNSWIWFRSEIGEFFIKVTTQPRWDLAIDTLQAHVSSWPMDPCSCGEACECYRSTVLVIPHRNDFMLKSLRCALLEHASEVMMQVYDSLIETPTGKIILGMLLAEGGTNMTEVQHILRAKVTYYITSRALHPQLDQVRLEQHTGAKLPLPVILPAENKAEKYSITLTSECGMDIRTYRILFIETG